MVRKFPSKENAKQSERGKTPMDAALSFLAAKSRTVREVERYLDDQQYGEYEVYSAVERLRELGYLDDEAYATEYVRSRLATKPISRAKLQEQLLSHELPRNIVERVLDAINDDQELQNAIRIARKYDRQLFTLEADERKQRIFQRMVGRGFSFEVSRMAIESLETQEH